jgi:hypothetical protein
MFGGRSRGAVQYPLLEVNAGSRYKILNLYFSMTHCSAHLVKLSFRQGLESAVQEPFVDLTNRLFGVSDNTS